MPKTKTFQSSSEGRVSVSVPGGWVEFEDGSTYETDDPAVIEALEANPDVEKAKTGAKKGKEK